jgi:dinuclear metal center YbgI/SA1388 family protein
MPNNTFQKTYDLLNKLDASYPFELAEKWDNVGLLIGDSKYKNVGQLFCSLDVTSDILKQIPNDSTLITHHPLIFKGLKTIDFNSYEGKLIQQIIQKNINYIVLHTNYDKTFLNAYFVEMILDIKNYTQENNFIYFYVNSSFQKNILFYIKDKLSITELNFVDASVPITKIAVCTGSGSSMLREAKANGADLLLTGDITYHVAMEAKEIGINLLDITHFHSEKYFGDDLVTIYGATKLIQKDPFKKV